MAMTLRTVEGGRPIEEPALVGGGWYCIAEVSRLAVPGGIALGIPDADGGLADGGLFILPADVGGRDCCVYGRSTEEPA